MARPASNCGNTFDYTPNNACASDEGPAAPGTACVGGTACDEALCCATSKLIVINTVYAVVAGTPAADGVEVVRDVSVTVGF